MIVIAVVIFCVMLVVLVPTNKKPTKKVKVGIWHVWFHDDNEHDDYDVDDVMVIMMIYKVTNTVASSNWSVWNDEEIELMVI